MVKVTLKDGVYWVGVVDWNIRDFHGYITRRGSSYNAYLITDEKTALVDTVKGAFCNELIEHISEYTSLDKLDYIVVNHVEMDHSSSLPTIAKIAKNAKIFASARGKEELIKHYGAEFERVEIVKSGDTVKLGKKTLTFLEAPMLHWPDSMFTYVSGSKTLLPNDAFGQHLATSKRFADEVDWYVALEEASTYYANILMPFGVPIRRMLDKIGEMGLEIEAIGPSHGVIWRRPEDVERLVAAYLNWTSFNAPERVTLVYDSMWHSTEKMTMAIADGVAQEGVECKVIKLSVSPRSEAAHQILESRGFLVGTPTLNNGVLPTIGGFLSYIKGLHPKARVAGAYGSCGWAGGGVKQVDEELRALGLDMLEPLEVKYAPSDAQLDACVELGRETARRVKAMG